MLFCCSAVSLLTAKENVCSLVFDNKLSIYVTHVG